MEWNGIESSGVESSDMNGMMSCRLMIVKNRMD